MASRAKHAANATSDSEDDLLTGGIDRAQPSKSTETKRRAPKALKADQMAPRKTATKRKAAAAEPRQVLADRTNVHDAQGTEAEDLDEDVVATGKPKAKRAKTTAGGTATAVAKSKATKAVTGRDAPVAIIPETQPEPELAEDVEQSIEEEAFGLEIAPEMIAPSKVQRAAQRAPSAPYSLQPRPSARPGSVQPVDPVGRERSGSASAPERRGGDPQLRRDLAELSKKYERLQMKYDSLEEIGKSDAETNFEKLKRASDQKAKDAHDLIVSLKKEVAELRKSTSSSSTEVAGLQKQVATLTSGNEKLAAERSTLKTTLQESQNEVKALEAKLTAARQQISNSAQEAKAQEAKNQSRNAPSAGLIEALKQAKLMENLYADLTGLIVRSVKQKDGEDEYNCIQTGRNGTLHFHLSVANDASTPHPKTPSGLSYEDAEFAYEPLLNEDRDRNLLDLLPDYLTEEICFPRNHAQRFYTKLVDSMTKKVIVEENMEDDG